MIRRGYPWKEFLIADLFETVSKGRKVQVPTGAWVPTKYLHEGSTPRITVTGVNNGVSGYYEDIDDANYRVYENFISVSFLGTIFYQAGKASLDMKVHCLKLKDVVLDKELALFLVAIIRQSISRFRYSDQLSSTVLPKVTISLPVTIGGTPDWEEMRRIMTDATAQSRRCYDDLSLARANRHKVESAGWKPFSIGGPNGLFRIEKGTRLTRANMREGTTPFIGASTANNGVTAYVGNEEHVHPGNVITVAYNGQKATGKAFYQPEPFWASDDVHVLYPNFEMNELRALFLLPIFRIVGEPYAFEDKWKIEYMEKDELPLPVDDDGSPDWFYMETYMTSVLENSRQTVEALTVNDNRDASIAVKQP